MSKEVTKIEKNEISTEITEAMIVDYVESFGFSNQLTKEHIKQFLNVAKAFNLNPFKREIYCIPYNTKNGTKLSLITGYESYLKRAERTGKLSGWKVWTEGHRKDNSLKAIIEISRHDWKEPFRHEVFFAEYNQNNSMWQTKPVTMIKKVAISSGFRMAFPDELGGMPYTSDELPDEMTKVEPINVTPKQETSKNADLLNETFGDNKDDKNNKKDI